MNVICPNTAKYQSKPQVYIDQIKHPVIKYKTYRRHRLQENNVYYIL